MANALYGLAREAFLTGGIDWATDDIKILLIDTGAYTVDIDVDQYHADIPGAAIIATSGNLAGKTTTLGVADADDITITGVAGATVEAIVIFKDTTVSATSPLIAYIDSATGLTYTPSGADVTVVWDSGANKIFKL